MDNYERYSSLLNWWYSAANNKRSELCRKFAGKASSLDNISSEERRFLVGCGFALRNGSITSGMERRLLEIFKTIIYELPDFEIPESSPPYSRHSITSMTPRMQFKLRKWQEEAFSAWKNSGRKGIIKAVTGSGKTCVALAAIEECLKEKGHVFVIVPTRALLKQWQKEIAEKLALDPELIGLAGGGSRCNPRRQKITVWVINSARKNLPAIMKDQPFLCPTLLIADECHRAGSKENSNLFSVNYDRTMGLSATPERQQDTAYERLLIPNLGKQVFNYSFPDAIRDKIIPPFDIVNLGVELNEDERYDYNDVTESIYKALGKLMIDYSHIRWHICKNYFKNRCYFHFDQLDSLCLRCSNYTPMDDVWESPQFFKFLNYIKENCNDTRVNSVFGLLFKRKDIVVNAAARVPLALQLLKKIPAEFKTIVFQERIKSASIVFSELRKESRQDNIGIYHSQMPDSYRKHILERFREGDINTLISCKALDEGLDVPSVNVGVIISSTSSLRQKIQRLGRILRVHPDKKKSVVFNIYVRNTTERNIMFRDLESDEMDKMAGFYTPEAGEERRFITEYLSLM